MDTGIEPLSDGDLDAVAGGSNESDYEETMPRESEIPMIPLAEATSDE